ncbi:MAG TPA: OmpA family protein [Deferrisomatales bacterium]|nr:OmpA family protein [Deferrisomatales bacterium]
MKHCLWFLAAAVVLTGCGVSKQVVAEKDAAMERCTGNLATCEEQLQASTAETERLRKGLDEARSRVDATGRERDTLSDQAKRSADEQARTQKDLAGSRKDLDAARQETATLKQREAELREKLDQQLRECTVDIERLRGQLRIRVLDQVFFNPGSADILPEGKAVLDTIATSLKDGDGPLRVEGHTDEVPIGPNLKGKWFSNWELSAARAASVVRYFQYAHSIDPQRMAVVGRSAFQPLAPNDSDANRRRNRRVEIVLSQAP